MSCLRPEGENDHSHNQCRQCPRQLRHNNVCRTPAAQELNRSLNRSCRHCLYPPLLSSSNSLHESQSSAASNVASLQRAIAIQQFALRRIIGSLPASRFCRCLRSKRPSGLAVRTRFRCWPTSRRLTQAGALGRSRRPGTSVVGRSLVDR